MSRPQVRARLEAWLNRHWYSSRPGPLWLLAPLHFLYASIVWLRRSAYRAGLLKSHRLPVPVIVVGNIVVGGGGKSPVISSLATALVAAGFRPGIVSRGYGRADDAVALVNPEGNASQYGDEPLMLCRATGLPVAVGRKRVAAARLLVEQGCDIILSDDGLQHYALGRDLELLIIPGTRRWGNGWQLPMGPLREPAARAAQCDFRLTINGDTQPGEYRGVGQPGALRSLGGGSTVALPEWSGREVFAVAGIAHPQAFFASLDAAGLSGPRIAFSDHHRFSPGDFAAAGDRPIVMTAKDAVKCPFLCEREAYSLDYSIALPNDLLAQIRHRLKTEESHS